MRIWSYRKYIPGNMGLGGFLEHDGISIGHISLHEYFTYSCS